MRSFKYAAVISIILLLSITSVFAAPRSITVRPGDAITQLTVRYDISQLMGEPTINGTYKWESDTVQQLDPDTVVWLKISNNINGSAFIRIDPVVPKRGEWGFNVTGSPNWDKVLVSQYEGNKAIKYVDAAIAKQFWGNGFQVVGAELSRKYQASATSQAKPQQPRSQQPVERPADSLDRFVGTWSFNDGDYWEFSVKRVGDHLEVEKLKGRTKWYITSGKIINGYFTFDIEYTYSKGPSYHITMIPEEMIVKSKSYDSGGIKTMALKKHNN